MKRCGNAPKGSKQHRLNVSSGVAESGYVSSVLDECRGDACESSVVGRTDGAGGEKFSARKEHRNFSTQGKTEEKRPWQLQLRARWKIRK
jgi:hypothetical protein